jgi:glycogen phosphorylase
VQELKMRGYNPWCRYESNPHLKEVIDQIASGFFSQGDAKLFGPLVESLLERDEYLLLEDYHSYIECQDRVSAAFGDQQRWTEMSILNVARMGTFSSDRSIREYCENIWGAKAVVTVPPEKR